MKWGYASAGMSIVASLATTLSIFLDVSSLSLALGIITVISCCITAFAFHFSIASRQPQRRFSDITASSSSSSSSKHPEPAFAAADERVNEESATTSIETSTSTHHDDESGLLSNSFFPVYLEQRITAARRTLRPVSLVIFELDGLDKNDSRSPSDRNFYISAVGDVVKRTLRESDCAFRVDANIFAAVMDDTTESGAVWAAERVRGVLHTGALAGRVTVSAGVACYPSHALESHDLIVTANKALGAARARGADQVEIAAEQ